MIGITGHTSGLGLALATEMPCIGFSRSNGYDIDDATCRRELISQLNNVDIFINNAPGFGQVKLLQELFLSWKDNNKLIINIGSRASEFNYPVDWLYMPEKSALMNLTKNLTLIGSNCRITTINFGYIGTNKIKEKGITEYIELQDAVEFVKTTIEHLSNKPKYRMPYVLYHG